MNDSKVYLLASLKACETALRIMLEQPGPEAEQIARDVLKNTTKMINKHT